MKSPIELKASLLSNGINLSEAALSHYGPPYLPKRRAYGNQDPVELRGRTIPQEVFLNPGINQLVAAVNVKPESPLALDYTEVDGGFHITDEVNQKYSVGFPHKPDFYDVEMSDGKKVSQVVTLYGGKSMGIFAYGKCQLVQIEKPCSYCSISQNREKGTDFEPVVRRSTIIEALEKAIKSASPNINQIMLNGGNFPDRDKSFLYYAGLARSIVDVIEKTQADIEAHLIVYPPEDLELINKLNGLPISIAMNTEVYNSKLFKQYCPGKAITGGQDHIFSALQKAVDVLGKGRVFSILVGGLEPIDSLDDGLHFLAERGITPVINVLHTDPETPLEGFPSPKVGDIIEMGRRLQSVYNTFRLDPFYLDCGRNSLDTEAYKNLFI